MADFSTIVNPSNTSLDLYCNSITTTAPSNNYAFAILASTISATTVNPGAPVLINWSSSQLQAYRNITIGGGDTTFTLEKIGNYLVDFNVALDAVSTAGFQNSVSLLVNGTVVSFDVAFGNGVSYYVYKGTLKAIVSKPTNAPVVISFRVSTLVVSGDHRYAQLSITKLE
jgi:hypothetical protein